jgi:uncharacterized membrane protein
MDNMLHDETLQEALNTDTQEIEALTPVGEEVPSNVTVAGHPIHPMLVTFPIAFLTTTLISDVVAMRTRRRQWAQLSRLSLTAGIASGLLAASAGALDFFTQERIRNNEVARFHMLANSVTMTVALVNLMMRRDAPNGPVRRSNLVLSLVMNGVLMIGGWLGGELVYRHKVGVNSAPTVPPSVDGAP